MDPVSLYKAAQLVIARGRVYPGYKRKYERVDVKVWTKSLTDVDLLERVFGGAHYPHRSGTYWILSDKKDQTQLLSLVKPWLTDANKVHLQKLIDYLPNAS